MKSILVTIIIKKNHFVIFIKSLEKTLSINVNHHKRKQLILNRIDELLFPFDCTYSRFEWHSGTSFRTQKKKCVIVDVCGQVYEDNLEVRMFATHVVATEIHCGFKRMANDENKYIILQIKHKTEIPGMIKNLKEVYFTVDCLKRFILAVGWLKRLFTRAVSFPEPAAANRQQESQK